MVVGVCEGPDRKPSGTIYGVTTPPIPPTREVGPALMSGAE